MEFTGFLEELQRDGPATAMVRSPEPNGEGFHPKNYRKHREWRVLKFLMPILNPDKPKRISLTMTNTYLVLCSESGL